jgi:hypothetical protein
MTSSRSAWQDPRDFFVSTTAPGGFRVRPDVPNMSSISASLTDYTVLPGIREVPLSVFHSGKPRYYSLAEERRTKDLARQIQASGELNPLIVVIDREGPYILEGGHRFDALRELGAKAFPAVVVLDDSDGVA